MNLRDEILAEHSKRQTKKIVDWVGDDPERFDQLIRLFLGDVYRVTQRAGWPLSNCVEKYPALIKPYFAKLLKQIERDDVHIAVRRNVVRLLQFVEIPIRYQGRIFNACHDLWADPAQPVAVRCFSMSVAANIAKGQPELMDELRLVAAEHPQVASAGIRARMRRVLGI
ncbi:MAG: hypothetical protein ABIO36_04360 [Pyrinomonadaceae bacterium]